MPRAPLALLAALLAAPGCGGAASTGDAERRGGPARAAAQPPSSAPSHPARARTAVRTLLGRDGFRLAGADQLALSPDGALVARSRGLSIHVFDTASGGLRHVLQAPAPETLRDAQLVRLAFSPRAKLLAAATSWGEVIVWDATDGTVKDRLANDEAGSARRFPIQRLAWSASGQWLAAIQLATGVHVWRLQPSALRVHIPERSDVAAYDNFRELAISDDGTLVATANDDGLVALWQAEHGTLLCTARSPKRAAAVDFYDGGRTLVSVHLDKEPPEDGAGRGHRLTTYAWDATRCELGRRRTHAIAGDAVALGPRGRLAATYGDKSVRLWDTRRGAELIRFEAEALDEVHISADGETAVGEAAAALFVFDLRRGRVSHRPRGHRRAVEAVDLSADGQRALSVTRDEARVWALPSGELLGRWELPDDGRMLRDAALSPDGSRIAVGWRAQGRRERTLIINVDDGFRRHVDGGRRVAWAPDGTTLVTSSFRSGVLELWDPVTGARKRRIELQEEGLVVVDLAWQGPNIAVVTTRRSADGGALLMLRPDDGTVVRRQPGQLASIRSAAGGSHLLLQRQLDECGVLQLHPRSGERAVGTFGVRRRPPAADVAARVVVWTDADVHVWHRGEHGRVEMPPGASPRSVALDAAGRWALVGNGDGSVARVDLDAALGQTRRPPEHAPRIEIDDESELVTAGGRPVASLECLPELQRWADGPEEGAEALMLALPEPDRSGAAEITLAVGDEVALGQLAPVLQLARRRGYPVVRFAPAPRSATARWGVLPTFRPLPQLSVPERLEQLHPPGHHVRVDGTWYVAGDAAGARARVPRRRDTPTVDAESMGGLHDALTALRRQASEGRASIVVLAGEQGRTGEVRALVQAATEAGFDEVSVLASAHPSELTGLPHAAPSPPPRQHGSACERGYRSAAARAEAEATRDGGWRPPARARFLKLCEQLPEPARECLATSYRRWHPARCREADGAADAEVLRRLHALSRTDPTAGAPEP